MEDFPVALRNTEHVADHGHRQPVRKIGDQIHMAARLDVIDNEHWRDRAAEMRAISQEFDNGPRDRRYNVAFGQRLRSARRSSRYPEQRRCATRRDVKAPAKRPGLSLLHQRQGGGVADLAVAIQAECSVGVKRDTLIALAPR